MIPFEDLVVALQSWRARQGLPTATDYLGGPASHGADNGLAGARAAAPSGAVHTAAPVQAPVYDQQYAPQDLDGEEVSYVDDDAFAEEAYDPQGQGADPAQGYDQSLYGQDQSLYGAPAPSAQHGGDQSLYGQDQSLYGQDQSLYDQDQSPYGQDQSPYGQDQSLYGAPQAQPGDDQSLYGAAPGQQGDQGLYGQDQSLYGQDQSLYGAPAPSAQHDGDQSLYGQDQSLYGAPSGQPADDQSLYGHDQSLYGGQGQDAGIFGQRPSPPGQDQSIFDRDPAAGDDGGFTALIRDQAAQYGDQATMNIDLAQTVGVSAAQADDYADAGHGVGDETGAATGRDGFPVEVEDVGEATMISSIPGSAPQVSAGEPAAAPDPAGAPWQPMPDDADSFGIDVDLGDEVADSDQDYSISFDSRPTRVPGSTPDDDDRNA